jgi:hypothetical protein
MTAMSVDRYLAVVRPLSSRQYRTPRHAAGACIATWAVCSVIMLPYWLYADVGPSSSGCQLRWPAATKLGHQYFWTVFEFVVGFAGPVVVMAVGYARLLRGLVYATRSVSEMESNAGAGNGRGGLLAGPGSSGQQNSSPRGGGGAGSPNSVVLNSASNRSTATWRSAASSSVTVSAGAGNATDRTRRQIRRVTAMVFAVTAAFVVCWTPYHIVRFMSLYKQWAYSEHGVKPSQSDALTFAVLNTIAQALIFASSCCNPFIYCISSSNFSEYSLFVMPPQATSDHSSRKRRISRIYLQIMCFSKTMT